MAEPIVSPIAVCLAGGITAACLQSISPDLAAYGVSGPSIIWGGVGSYAGEMLRRMQAQDSGRAYAGMRGLLLVSGAIGAAAGPWLASVLGGSSVALAGCSILCGTLCMPILGGLAPIVIDSLRAVATRVVGK